MQMPQEIQVLKSNRGIGHFFLGIRTWEIPKPSCTAPAGQTRPQALHSMQISPLIQWICFFSPVTAPVGQIRVHDPHPTHAFEMVKTILFSFNRLPVISCLLLSVMGQIIISQCIWIVYNHFLKNQRNFKLLCILLTAEAALPKQGSKADLIPLTAPSQMGGRSSIKTLYANG